jgi:tetratricopeptide (TPR) repeat protein
MYLHTPKRYTTRGRRRRLVNLRWLWLYLIAPPVIIAAALAWNFRGDLSKWVGDRANSIRIDFNAPTPTATLPARDLEARIQLLLGNGSLNDAIDAMRSLGEAQPNETTWHTALAQTLILRSRQDPKLIQQAADAGQQAINANPETADGWATMALVLDWSSQPQKALAYALRARDLGDAGGMAQAALAGIYVSLGDYKLAASTADEALKTNPNLAYAYYVKGQIASFTGANKDALSLYRQAWDISKGSRVQWGGYIADALATLYKGTNQLDQAVSLIQDAIPRDRDYPVLYSRLSDIYIQRGDYDKALESSQSCIDHDSSYAPCYVLLIRLQYREAQWEKVVQSAQRAIDLGTQQTAAYYYGGYAQYKLNRCPEAITWWNLGMTAADKVTDQVTRSKLKSDFASALSDCGVVSNVEIVPTATVTPTAGPTPRKK